MKFFLLVLVLIYAVNHIGNAIDDAGDKCGRQTNTGQIQQG